MASPDFNTIPGDSDTDESIPGQGPGADGATVNTLDDESRGQKRKLDQIEPGANLETGAQINKNAKTNTRMLFQIPLVLAKIVKFMRAVDIVTLRPTCTLWNTFMVPEVKARGVPLECGNCNPANALRQFAGVDVSAVDNNNRDKFDILAATLRKTQTQRTGIPFNSLRIRIEAHSSGRERILWAPNLLDTPPVRELFAIWSLDQLKKLEIHISSDNSRLIHVNGLRNLVFVQSPGLSELKLHWHNANCQNLPIEERDTCRELTQLKILDVSVNVTSVWNHLVPSPVNEYMTELVRDLLRSAPNLEGLTMERDAVAYIAFDFMIKHPSVCQALTKLEIGTLGGTEASTLSQLVNLSRREEPNCLHLTTFKGRITVSSLDGDRRHRQSGRLLGEFLQLQSLHLKDLSIDVNRIDRRETDGDPPPPRSFDIEMPAQMSELSNLDLVARNGTKLRWRTCPCPKLRQLSLQLAPFSQNGLDEHSNLFSTAPITDLDLTSFGCEVKTSAMLDKLATAVPCLTRLAIKVNRELLPQFWTKWPQLVYLHLCVIVDDEDSDLDSDITGITSDQCQQLLERVQTGGQIDHIEAGRAKVSPGIQDCSCLRSFILGTGRWIPGYGGGLPISTTCFRVNITDVTGYYALALLQTISVLGVTKISDECLAAIKTRIGMSSVIDIYNKWEMS